VDPPRPVRLRDESREESMARRRDALRAEGRVVAVVGQAHLDSVANRLAE
jgi:pheromone shutdown protein TraB